MQNQQEYFQPSASSVERISVQARMFWILLETRLEVVFSKNLFWIWIVCKTKLDLFRDQCLLQSSIHLNWTHSLLYAQNTRISLAIWNLCKIVFSWSVLIFNCIDNKSFTFCILLSVWWKHWFYIVESAFCRFLPNGFFEIRNFPNVSNLSL